MILRQALEQTRNAHAPLCPRTYAVQMIGEPDVGLFEAHSATDAVALAAECDWRAVCLPIWWVSPRTKTPRAPIGTECYMPRDDSGRQWLVRDLSPAR
jgi:hypothetical protein